MAGEALLSLVWRIDNVLEYNRTLLARLNRREKLSFTSPSLCSDFKGNSDVSELIRACNIADRSRPTPEHGRSSSSAPRPYAADQSSGNK